MRTTIHLITHLLIAGAVLTACGHEDTPIEIQGPPGADGEPGARARSWTRPGTQARVPASEHETTGLWKVPK